MTTDTRDKLRALLLASLMALSIVAGSVALAGGVGAQSSATYGLNATDGAGGQSSTLLANFDGQLPEGNESGNDTLQVVAEDENLPNVTEVSLSLESGAGVTFDTSQNLSAVTVEVFGENVTDTEGAEVSNLTSDRVEISVDYDGSDQEDVLLLPKPGSEHYDPAKGIRVRNLAFNTSDSGPATLTWQVRNDDAEYELDVQPFDAEIEATDENGGHGAILTAGGDNQTIVGAESGYTSIDTEAADTLVLEGEVEEFPERFDATLTIDDSGTSFSEALTEADVSASSPHGNVSVESVTETEIVVRVTGYEVQEDALFSLLEEDESVSVVLEVNNVTFDVPADAGVENVTWTVRNQSTGYKLTPDRLDVTVPNDHEIPRGLDQQPESGVTVEVDSLDSKAYGFHKGGENMTLHLPENGLKFDRSAEPQGIVDYPDTLDLEDDDVTEFWIDDESLTFRIPNDVHNDTTVTVSNVRFNTTQFDATAGDENASFDSGLSVEYCPVDPHEHVRVETDSTPFSVATPEVTLADGATPVLEAGADGQAGSEPITVNVTDTSGDQMAANSEIRIGIVGDDGISFDIRQADDLKVRDTTADFWADVVSVESDEIVLEATGSRSSAGDSLLLEHTDGEGIRFNASEATDGDSITLSVRTTAGDAPVTQVTDAITAIFGGNATLTAQEDVVTVHRNETVTVNATDGDGPVSDLRVTAYGEPLDANVTRLTGDDGTVELPLPASETGTIFVEGTNTNAIEISAARADITPEPSTVVENESSNVTVTVDSARGEPIDDVLVNATGEPIENDSKSTTDGTVEFEFEPDQNGTITLEAPDLGIGTSVRVVAARMHISPEEISVGELTDVEVTLERNGDPVQNATVSASNESDALEGTVSRKTDENGTVVLPVEPVAPGQITVEATSEDGEFTVTDDVEAVADITVVDADNLSAGESAEVRLNVTGANSQPLDDVEVHATGDPIENTSDTTQNGEATFAFEPTEGGVVTFEALGTQASVSISGPSLDVSEPEVTAGKNTSVTVTVTNVDEPSGITVTADGPLKNDPENETTDDGSTTLHLDTDEVGSIAITASTDDFTVEESIESVADMTLEPSEIDANDETNVSVTLTGARDEAIANATVTASGTFEGDDSGVTDENGTAVLTISATDDADSISVSALGLTETIDVNGTDDGDEETPNNGNTDTGGIGGGGGGASPTTYADINVTDVSLSATEIRQGETVDVTVTLVNDGSADGTYDVLVRANTLRVASETVDVPKGETREVTVPVTFAHAGERKITVDGVEGGTVTIREIEPEDIPDGTTVADAQPVVDMDAEINGTVVEFDENVTVDAIVFGNASNGTVTVADLEALPADVPQTPGRLLRAMEIVVPAALENESATIRLSLDASEVEDREAVRLGRFHDGEWQTLQPTDVSESGGELVYEFETPGFSTFAVFAQETEDPQVTETPQGTDASSSTATDTDDGGTEEAGFGTFGMVAIAFIALIAVLLAAAGARMYQQNKP